MRFKMETMSEQKQQKIHFIAIGGSIMHSLAIALKKEGHHVTGSDDEIFEPSRSKLEAQGLLPDEMGWHPERIHKDLDAVVLGMHAKKDNPELIEAEKQGLKVYSFPEFIREQSRDKQRIVIAGSHGKTTITAMLIHVLSHTRKNFDYVLGAALDGIENQVKLTDAPIIIIEGDEYLSSALDPKPKFLAYEHHIALISGIAWDHVNVFPTIEEYAKQFEMLADASPKAGTLIYCEDDDLATTVVCSKERLDVTYLPYKTHPHFIEDGKTFLSTDKGDIPLKIFGKHNMQNIAGAKELLKRIGVDDDTFYKAIKSFTGASKRLELVGKSSTTSFYLDYAHSPSKVHASCAAIKAQYTERKLTAVLELYTFSSQNKEFLTNYKDTLISADEVIIYRSNTSIKHQDSHDIDEAFLRNAFNYDQLKLIEDKELLKERLLAQNWEKRNLLMMSSGNFDGIDIKALTKEILKY